MVETGVEETLTELRRVANRAESALLTAVDAACPGPHRVVQHRDGKVQWCPACGRSARGMVVVGGRS